MVLLLSKALNRPYGNKVTYQSLSAQADDEKESIDLHPIQTSCFIGPYILDYLLFSGIGALLCHHPYCFLSQSQTLFGIGTGRPNRIGHFRVSKTLTFTSRLKDEFYLQENKNQFHINSFVLILALKRGFKQLRNSLLR